MLAESLPKDDGEFYQFVYVSQAKQIRVASVPFQFIPGHESAPTAEKEQRIVSEDEQDTVVIK